MLGSFIFGLPTDKPATFDATAELAMKAGITFAQFVMMTPFPGTVDFGTWEKRRPNTPEVGDIPITRYWLIPADVRPKMFTPHPAVRSDEIRERTQNVWDKFYGERSGNGQCVPTLRGRLGFLFVSKLYRQMYADTGISTDSARRKKSKRWARWTAHQCKKLFRATPMPELAGPVWPEKGCLQSANQHSPAFKATQSPAHSSSCPTTKSMLLRFINQYKSGCPIQAPLGWESNEPQGSIFHLSALYGSRKNTEMGARVLDFETWESNEPQAFI